MVALCKPRKELPLRTKSAGTLTLDSSDSKTEKRHLLFSHPVCVEFYYSSQY